MERRTRPLESPGLVALARRQSGVVRRPQLAALGITRHHVRSQLEAGRWRAVGPLVVVLHNGPVTGLQRRWIGVLHAGPQSWVAGLTSLQHQGLRGWDDEAVHVLTPHGARVSRMPGLVVHVSRHVDPEDIEACATLPLTTVARSAVDAARWQRSSRRASGLVLAVVQQRLARPVELLDCLVRLGHVTHADAIRTAIVDASGGADSLAEVEVARLAVRAGLPRPRRQVVIETLEGPRRVDMVVDLPDGRLLVLEVDGMHHLSVDVRLADAAKDAALIAAGHHVLHIPVTALRHDSEQVLRQLVAIRDAARRPYR